MKNEIKNKRIGHELVYNCIITIIMAFAILWIIYVSIPYSHYNLYFL